MFFPIGFIFRRYWGGWQVPPHMVKVTLAYLLASLIGLFVIHGLYAALAFGVIIGTAFLNPFHSWGMGMGFDNSGKSTLACAAVMGGSYGFFTALAAVVVWFLTKDVGYVWYAAAGFLVPVPYILAWIVAIKRGYATDPTKMQFLKIGGEWFIDSPTAVGECFLGALLFCVAHV